MIYYDPYDIEIDINPYPVWQRMRDEAPLYRNEKYDFWALSRFDDVSDGLTDWRTYSSAHGTILEFLRNKVPIPPGTIVFEDPPLHDARRGLLAHVFTPRRVAELEPRIRAYCARSLDPLVGSSSIDFVAHLGSQMPMRVIGMLLGIPEADQGTLGETIKAGMNVGEREAGSGDTKIETGRQLGFSEYIEWRRKNPSDDLMTELMRARFVDGDGVERTLRDDEVLTCTAVLAAAGNETTTHLIGWMGYLLDQFPDQRQLLVRDRSLIPNAIEEILRYEAVSPVQGRYVTRDIELYGTKVPEGATMMLVNGSANRDEREFDDPNSFDVRRKKVRHLSFGYGIHFCLGASLARLEAKIALEELLTRWPEWKIDQEKLVRVHTSTMRGFKSLPAQV